MNTSSPQNRCPACSAEIPANAPQGLCPKCLLLGVASSVALSPEASASSGSPTARATRRSDRSPPPSPQELAAAFPQLEIVELIGRGGMGFVYRARQTKLDRWVALKILPGHLANESSFRERFEREARVMAKLQHPQIVSVFDFGEALVPSLNSESSVGAEHSYFYLMLEYVDGVNLREAMKAGRFTPEQALAVVPQVCEALQYAHSKGVLHRDIKPENILLDTDGRVKIADFGIAKVLGPGMDPAAGEFAAGASESEVAVTRLTATGSVLGTPLYMAPEQLISPNAVDHRADIFSLGVVFYEMLTGELPMGRFAPPSEKSHVDQRIDEIVLRALAKERELRQQSANEMKSEVESIATHSRRPIAPPTTPPPIPSTEPSEPDRAQGRRGSGVLGWLALASLPIGTFVAVLPLITVRAERTTANGDSFSAQPTWIMIVLMLMFTVGGTVLPACLGWAHLLIQRAKHARAGVIPALIAAWFVPLLILNGLPVLLLRLDFPTITICLIVDILILVTTWHWATRTPYSWLSSTSRLQRGAPASPAKFWGWGLIILSILLTVGCALYSVSVRSRMAQDLDRDIQQTRIELKVVQARLNAVKSQWQVKNARNPQTHLVEITRQYERDLEESEVLTRRIDASLSKAASLRGRIVPDLPFLIIPLLQGISGVLLLKSRDGMIVPSLAACGTLTGLFLGIIVLAGHRTSTVSPVEPEPSTASGRALTDPKIVRDDQIAQQVVKALQASKVQGQISVECKNRVVILTGVVPTVADRTIAQQTAATVAHVASVDNQLVSADDSADAEAPAGPSTKVLKPPPVPNMSPAAATARKQNLITIDDLTLNITRAEQPVVIPGIEGDVTVVPGTSRLIKLSTAIPLITVHSKPAFDQQRMQPVQLAYPCDHVVCDWTGERPRIVGYVQPPGIYGFHGSPAVIAQFSELSYDSQVAVGAHLLKLLRGASTSVVSSTEWLQATMGESLRCQFVPRSISGLDVPDQLQVVMTRNSRTILTCTADRYTKHELPSAVPLNRFATSMVTAVNAENDSDIKRFLQRAEQSIRDKQWVEFQTCLTDDCRNDWIFEALLADTVQTELNETYSSLSMQERRQWRIGRVRQSGNSSQDLNFVRACRSRPLPPYLTRLIYIPIMPLGDDMAIGNATLASGKTVSIVLRSINLDEARVWRIESFFESSYDPPAAPPPADAARPENQRITPPMEATP